MHSGLPRVEESNTKAMSSPAHRGPLPSKSSCSFSFSCGFRADFVQQFKYTGSRLHYTAHLAGDCEARQCPAKADTAFGVPRDAIFTARRTRDLTKLAASAVAVHPPPTFGSEAWKLTTTTIKRKLRLSHNSQVKKESKKGGREKGSPK